MASVSEIKAIKEVVEEDLALVGKNSGCFSKATEAMDKLDRSLNKLLFLITNSTDLVQPRLRVKHI